MDDITGPLGARFDHVAVGGPSMRDLFQLWSVVMGGVPIGGGVNTAGGFRTVQVGFPDGRHVELIAATPGSPFLDSFLERTNGQGGLHHVTFTVPDLRAALEHVHAAGYRTFGENLDDPVWAEAFVHPRDSGGVLLQLAQKGEGMDDVWAGAWEEAGWDDLL